MHYAETFPEGHDTSEVNSGLKLLKEFFLIMPLTGLLLLKKNMKVLVLVLEKYN